MGTIKTLDLGEEYILEVRVKDTDQLFAGQLTLSPSGCKLRVMSERETSDGFIESSYLECSTISNKFFLFNLSYSGRKWIRLAKQADNNIFYYEIYFEIGFVVCSRNISINELIVSGYQLSFPMLSDWVGVTTTQNDLLVDKRNFLADEFELLVGDERVISCTYTKNIHYDRISSGTKISPILHISLLKKVHMSDVLNDILQTYDLMALFLGGDFKLNFIKLGVEFNNDFSLYFPTNFKKLSSNTSILPLAHNHMHSNSLFEPLDLSCIANYYMLSEENKDIFAKFLRYKRLNSIEEKFLGYFRLLEKLSYQEQCYVDSEELELLLAKSKRYLVRKLKTNIKNINSLSGRIISLNKSKYNTESCIRKFYDSLTVGFKEGLDFDIKDLNKVTKLRNDITHANYYVHDEEKLYKYTCLVHALLYMGLIKEIGLSLELGDLIVKRVNTVN